MILDDKIGNHSVTQNLLFQQMKALISANRQQVQNQSQKNSLLPNLQFLEYQSFVFSQYQMIAKQNEFLEQIKQEISKKKNTSNHQILFCGSNPNTMDILPMESSFDMSSISAVQGFDDEPFKTKFGQQFQKSLLASALNDVQQNCSSQTYEAIKNSVLTSKQKQFQTISQKYQKLIKKHEELQTSFIIKSTQLAQMQVQLKEAQQKIDFFQEQKKKLKAKSNQISEKQKRIYKLQTAMVFKQKLFNEGKKRYQREKNLFLSIQERLNSLYKKMQKIWEQILIKMQQSSKAGCLIPCQSDGDASSCWKKQVMKKCKQQLIDQRNLLRQQQEQIQKQFEMLQSLSQQVKKLVNQKDSSPNTDPFSSQPSSIIFQAR